MTFCMDPTPLSEKADGVRRLKDVAYFGLDAVGWGRLERVWRGGKGAVGNSVQ